MKTYRGISLIEVMLGLSIGAALLLAVASAVHASSMSMTTNEQFFKATQAARLSILNITTALRSCDNAVLGSPQPALTREGPHEWPESEELNLIHVIDKGTPQQRNKTSIYRLVPATAPDRFDNLILEVDGQKAVLARNVSALKFTGQLHKRAYVFCQICNIQMDQTAAELYTCPQVPAHTSGPWWDLANVQIRMTVQVGNNAVSMSNSVVPRKVIVVR